MTATDFSSLERVIGSLEVLLKQEVKEVYGTKILNLFLELVQASQKSDDFTEARNLLKSLSLEEIKKITHCFTIFFLLSNQAEQCEIVKIKKLRQKAETPESPRSESIAEAVLKLKQSGLDAEQIRQMVSALHVTPTITAHPTESRRRSVLKKQLRIAEILFDLNKVDLPVVKRSQALSKLEALIASLLLTDDVRANRLSVQDEVENGLFFLSGAILEIVPDLINDLRNALKNYCQIEINHLKPVSYRSWIGGDRDGNPKVTVEVTKEAVQAHTADGLAYYIKQLSLLRDELSISSRKAEIPTFVEESIKQDKLQLGLNPELFIDPHQIYEPLREKCHCIRFKLEQQAKLNYTAEQFLEDLYLLERALKQVNLGALAETALLGKLIDQLKSFGFSLAQLDLRQHSAIHEKCLEEIFRLNNICTNYTELSEQAKLNLLEQELDSEKTLSTEGASEQVVETLNLFSFVRELAQKKDASFGNYIISMTHTVSDMLEPLVLWKLSARGLFVYNSDFVLDLSPLFETIEDLDNCGPLLSSILENKHYRKYLQSRANFQEVMLGYSDSNKDGGYASANILLYDAQLQIAKVCLEKKVDFQIFHGRGGSVGRGGGRAGRAIQASPADSNNGKVRLTEQGEVISFRYSLPEIGHRHLEQILSATLLAAKSQKDSLTSSELAVLRTLAKHSILKYRKLVDDPNFWEWYVAITPIQFISSLPIASRPVMRSGANLEFENLRAIPWVFSWTQTRYNIPSWYGLGYALEAVIKANDISEADLKKLYSDRIFFKTLIDNAQQEMARARLEIAAVYADRSPQNFHAQIVEEFERSKKYILTITGQKQLLDNNPTIQKSIARRNPFTDPLSLIQNELLSRVEGSEQDLSEAVHMSISGLAAAMQTTG